MHGLPVRLVLALLLGPGLCAACSAPPPLPPTVIAPASVTPLTVPPSPATGISPAPAPPANTAVTPSPDSRGRSTLQDVTPGAGAAPPTNIYPVQDLAFADTNHGWALGYCQPVPPAGCLAIKGTSDGGRTWHSLPGPPATPRRPGVATAPGTRQVSGIRFANARDGWLFNPSLLTTHDGGQTWQDESPPGSVVALEAQASDVWAVEQVCDPAPCRTRLLQAATSGGPWIPAAGQPPLAWPTVQLVRVSPRMAWIFAGDPSAVAPAFPRALAQTTDGGRTWQTLPAPPCMPDTYTQLAALPDATLWLLCAGEPGAGMQGKALLISPDGGRRWDQVAAASSARGGSLPLNGYVASLAVQAQGHAWIVYNRGGGIGATTDAGHTWRYITLGNSDVNNGPVRFVDAQHGWLVAGDSVFRTDDGGATWQGVLLNSP